MLLCCCLKSSSSTTTAVGAQPVTMVRGRPQRHHVSIGGCRSSAGSIVVDFGVTQQNHWKEGGRNTLTG